MCKLNFLNLKLKKYTILTFAVAPVITENPEDTDFLFGSTGYLNCLVRGVPEPTLQWTKNDEPLNFDDGRIKMFENGSLVFRDVMLNDTGSYACNASSELGYTYSDTAIVMVNGKFSLSVSSFECSQFSPAYVFMYLRCVCSASHQHRFRGKGAVQKLQ